LRREERKACKKGSCQARQNRDTTTKKKGLAACGMLIANIEEFSNDEKKQLQCKGKRGNGIIRETRREREARPQGSTSGRNTVKERKNYSKDSAVAKTRMDTEFCTRKDRKGTF